MIRDPIPVYVHLRRAKDLIDRDFAKPLDIPALAGKRTRRERHFIRSFKKAFGETPHRYVQQRRIERAKELLRNTPLSVTEVSVGVGFRSLGSFSTARRPLNIGATTGVPPEEQGLASGLVNTSFQFGGAFVLAVGTAVINANTVSGSPRGVLDGYVAGVVVSVIAATLGVFVTALRFRRRPEPVAEQEPAVEPIAEPEREAA